MEEEKIFVPVNRTRAVHGSVRQFREAIAIPCLVHVLMCGAWVLCVQANPVLTYDHQEGR